MARLFDDASSEALYVSGIPATGFPFTMACWAKTDDLTVDQDIFLINRDAGYPRGYGLSFSGAQTGDPISAFMEVGSRIRADSAGSYSTNTWYHLALIVDATDLYLYVDGVESSVGNSYGLQTRDSIQVGRLMSAEYGAQNHLSGSVAEAVIWDAALTPAEISSLAKGFSPKLIRPEDRTFYLPLLNDDDEDLVGGLSFSVTGTPVEDEHPNIIYPTRVLIPAVSITGAVIETIGLSTSWDWTGQSLNAIDQELLGLSTSWAWTPQFLSLNSSELLGASTSWDWQGQAINLSTDVSEIIAASTSWDWIGQALTVTGEYTETIAVSSTWGWTGQLVNIYTDLTETLGVSSSWSWSGKALNVSGDELFDNITRGLDDTIRTKISFEITDIDRDYEP